MENKNEPAFPDPLRGGAPSDITEKEPMVLTKREYFAGLAMQGLCANDFRGTLEAFARKAVEMADALLFELSKPQP